MSGQFSKEDVLHVRGMVEAGVFEEINPSRLTSFASGTVACKCADGRWSIPLLTLLQNLQRPHRQGNGVFVHTLSLHGGPLRIRPGSRANKEFNLASAWEYELELAATISRSLAGNKSITLLGHGPCGMAARAGMTFLETVEELVATKRYIRMGHPDWFESIICMMHLAVDGAERVYFVNPRQFERWLIQNAA
ncbi:MAG: hypothetical protein A3G08_02905 [Candidatus Magasanikbacteria bacterium RIFCSPLOWO2_12_FULL_47_9b]|nr:MAG: hypothetical protein A3I74_02750 [Candidatus Magasanikbacteria bacterium RIFCSPLOWO2_02_FULL_47_16]OGH82840.1 MAG: hypothetical protein A3G08_02905 [Candidatus Magasanikbacteria bacterium RIFCSPLOWO2_12_FULL_47_9b]